MAIYRRVHVSFWQDPFILNLTSEEKYFYLYLMTNSKTALCGCYELPKIIMAMETGLDPKDIESLTQKFIKLTRIWYSDLTQEILLLNWHKYNDSESDKYLKCLEKEIEEIKDDKFSQYCIDTLSLRKTKTKTKRKSKEYTKEFLSFWDLYPRKEKKNKAFESWDKVGEENHKTIFKKLEKFINSDQWSIENGKYIPHAVSWLNQRRWEDDPKPKKQIKDHTFLTA